MPWTGTSSPSSPVRLQRFTARGDHPTRLERGEAGPQPDRPLLRQVEEPPSQVDRGNRKPETMALAFRPRIWLRHAPQEIAAGFLSFPKRIALRSFQILWTGFGT